MELKKLAREDGWNNWRIKEAEELNEIIQQRIFKLQVIKLSNTNIVEKYLVF